MGPAPAQPVGPHGAAGHGHVEWEMQTTGRLLQAYIQVGDASYVPPEHLFLALKLHILNAKKCLFILQHISRVKGSSSQPSGIKLHLQPQFKVA